MSFKRLLKENRPLNRMPRRPDTSWSRQNRMPNLLLLKLRVKLRLLNYLVLLCKNHQHFCNLEESKLLRKSLLFCPDPETEFSSNQTLFSSTSLPIWTKT